MLMFFTSTVAVMGRAALPEIDSGDTRKSLRRKGMSTMSVQRGGARHSVVQVVFARMRLRLPTMTIDDGTLDELCVDDDTESAGGSLQPVVPNAPASPLKSLLRKAVTG